MSVRPRPHVEIPELTARMAHAGNPAGTKAMWVRDPLDGLWKDEDFTDCYSRNGRPALSSAQLATVSVPQFLPGLSDRDAAEVVRCRIDFTYALGLELESARCSLISYAEVSGRDLRNDRFLLAEYSTRAASSELGGPLW